MITKGIVESIVDKYSIKVRLPIFDKAKDTKNATPTQDLNNATICTLPNSEGQLSEGDIVFVGFEDNDTSKPIILGQLYRDIDQQTLMSLTLGALTTTSTTNLNKLTTIGDVKSNEIECLVGIKSNIQQQLNEIISRIDEITKQMNGGNNNG